MPTVRYGERKVKTAPLPGVRRQAGVTDLAAGVGVEQARQQKYGVIGAVGDEASNLGHHFAQVVIQEKERADDVAAMEAATSLAKWKQKRLLDPENGALAQKGSSAMGLPETVNAEYEAYASEVGKSMKTDRQRDMFAKAKASEGLNLDMTLRRHVFEQMQELEKDTLKGFVDTKTQDAIANANDPNMIAQSLASVTEQIKKSAPRLGLEGPALESTLRAARTQIHAGVINRLLDNGQDRKAAFYYNGDADTPGAKDQMDGKVRGDIEKALEAGSIRGESQRQSDKIIQDGGTLTQQREKAKAIEDPKVRDEVMGRLEHESAVQDREERQAEETRSTQGYTIVDRTKDVASIPATLWASYNGQTRSALRGYAAALTRQEAIETDPSTYYSLMQQASGAPGYGTPSDFVKQNLLNYKAKLGETEFKQLTSLQMALRSNDQQAADKTLAGFRTHGEILKGTLTQYGIDPNAKPDTPEGKAVAQLARMLDLRVEAAQATGQKVTNVEVQSTLDDLLSQSVTVPGSFWNFWPGGKSMSDTSKRLIETTPGDIPAGTRKAIEDRLRAKGRPVSDATVLDVYVEMQVK